MSQQPHPDLAWVQENWDRLGRADPFWAVLTDPEKKGGRWREEEFFATGRAEVAALVERVADLLPARGRALDFGCGPGRLTQALAERFERVDGVDVAPSMVELARRLNRHGVRCVYHLNPRPDLALFPDGAFDLAYSNITLQHLRPRLALRYLAELVRVLRPGGALVFQLPAERLLGPGRSLARLRGALRRAAPEACHRLWRRLTAADDPFLDMNSVPRERVIACVGRAGGRVVAVEPDAAPGSGWVSYRYTVVKGV